MLSDPAFRTPRATTWLLVAVFSLVAALGCQTDLESRLTEIRALQQAGEYNSSIKPLRVILHREPSHAEANYRLGMALMQTGRRSLAVWPLQKASETEKYSLQAGVMLASILLSTEDFEEAVRITDKVLEKHPESASALHIRGKSNLGASRPEEALADAERLLELNPEDYSALTLHVAALIDLGRLDEAEQDHVRLKEFADAGDNVDLKARSCAMLARFHAVRERPDEAEAGYAQCLQDYPAHQTVLQLATNFYLERGRSDEAIAIWRRAIEEVPENFVLRSKLTNLLQRQGKSDEAREVLTEAAELFDTLAAWQALSSFHKNREEFTAAREALAKALERAPSQPASLRFALADLLIVEGDYDQAEEIAANLKEPAYRNLLNGSILLGRGDPKGALEIFEAGLRLWPNNAGARFLAGQAAQELGDIPRAIAEYREAVRVDQKQTEAALQLARLHMALGEWKAAQAFAERHLNSRPYTDPAAHVIGARAAAAQGDFPGARRILENLRGKDIDGATAWVELAGILAQSQGAEAALVVIERSELDLTDPVHVAALRSLIHNLSELGRSSDAAKAIDNALAAHPEEAVFLDLKGRALIEAGRGDEAVAVLERAAANDPELASPLEALSLHAARSGDLDAALEYSQRAATAAPRSPEPLYRSAQVELQRGRRAEAIKLLRSAYALEPGHLGTCNDLASLLAEDKTDLGFALLLANRAVRLRADPNTLDTLGWVLHQRGEYPEAIDAFRRALEDRPHSAPTQYRLAMALESSGDSEQALELVRRSLDGGPFAEADDARVALARLEGR